MLHNLIVIEIQSGHAIIGLRFLRLFFDGNGTSVCVKLHNTKTFWIIYIITKYRSALLLVRSPQQSLLQTVSCKNVIAQDHGNMVIPDKLLANDERLSQSVWRRLNCVR